MNKSPERNIRIYLDQNIIQYIYEGKLGLKKTPHITYVFSNENLKEYSKHKDPRFFDVLRDLEARKLEIQLDDEFRIKDEAIILPYKDPEEIYNERLELYESKMDSEDIATSILALAYGDKNSLNPGEMKELLINSIMSPLKDLWNETEIVLPDEIMSNLNLFLEQLGTLFQNAIKGIHNQTMPIDKMRKAFSKKQLSTLSSDNGKIIDQISELIDGKIPNKYKDQMFGKEPIDYIQKKTTSYTSVRTCYSSLNIVGYKPDSGLTKKNRVESSLYDAAHVANAIFCDVMISSDKKLCEKTKAIYEYFGINTMVVQAVTESVDDEA